MTGRGARIGRCDLCGLVDHHLVDGLCVECRRRGRTVRRARIEGCVRVERDEAGNPTIRLRPREV